MGGTRKIAAILVADIVGYSRLAGTDEDRTLSRLRGLRSDLVDPAIAAASWAHRQAHWRRQPHRVPQRGRRRATSHGYEAPSRSLAIRRSPRHGRQKGSWIPLRAAPWNR